MTWWSLRRQRRNKAAADDVAGDALAARALRRAQTADRRDLVAEVSRILFAADPIGLNFERNSDEYDSEAESIVIALPTTKGVDDVQVVTHEAFVQWFDPDIAGEPGAYRDAALQIWQAWTRRDNSAGQQAATESQWAGAGGYYRDRISPLVRSILEDEDPWQAYDGVVRLRGLMVDDLGWLPGGDQAFIAWANLEDTFETGKTPIADAHQALRQAANDWLSRTFDTPDDMTAWFEQAQAITTRLRERDGDWWHDPS